MKYFIRFFGGTHNIMKKVGVEERFIADFESLDEALEELDIINSIKERKNLRSKKMLHLVLKHKWYDMIASGVKKEEYRAITPYWENRFIEQKLFSYRYGYSKNGVIFKEYKYVTFHKGYSNTTMTFKIDCIKIGLGNPEWGAPVEDVFIIQLGERIE